MMALLDRNKSRQSDLYIIYNLLWIVSYFTTDQWIIYHFTIILVQLLQFYSHGPTDIRRPPLSLRVFLFRPYIHPLHPPKRPISILEVST